MKDNIQGKNIAILLSSFHQEAMQVMLQKAKEQLAYYHLSIANEVWVPGAMEFPFALQKIFQETTCEGAVVLGLIEKGETSHGLVMAQSVITALIQLQLQFSKSLGVGILGPEIQPEQIQQRLHPYAKAAVVALYKMLNLKL